MELKHHIMDSDMAEDEESDHQTVEPDGLRQSKVQNGIERELLHEIWLPGISSHQATKRCFNASTSFSHTNSGRPSNNKLCNCASGLGTIICLELHLAMWRRELLQEGSIDGASGLLKSGARTGLITPWVQ